MEPGSYRLPLADGLKKLGEHKLAEQTLAGDLKIAVASSIYGPVIRREDLRKLYLAALEACFEESPDVASHYINGLRAGLTVPVVAVGVDAIYADGRTTPTPGPEKVWHPGELFLKS